MSRRGGSTAAFSLFSFQDIITSVTGIMILVTLILALELIQRKESSPPVHTEEIAQNLQSTVTEMQNRIEELKRKSAESNKRIDELAPLDKRAIQRDLADSEEANQRLDGQVEELERRKREAEQRMQEAERLLESQSVDPDALEKLQAEVRKKEEDLEELKSSDRIIYNRAPGDSKTPWLVEVSGDGFSVAEVGKSAPPKIFRTVGALGDWLAQRNSGSEYFVLFAKPDGIANFHAGQQMLQQKGFDVGYDLLGEEQKVIDPETGAGAP